MVITYLDFVEITASVMDRCQDRHDPGRVHFRQRAEYPSCEDGVVELPASG